MNSLKSEYFQLEMIGKGSFGEVFEVLQTQTRQSFALKKVKGACNNLLEHLREVKMMKKCVHENIIQIIKSEIVEQDLWVSWKNCYEFFNFVKKDCYGNL